MALTIGDLLAEVVSRQQKLMPLEDQLALDDATLDAMLDRASREYVNLAIKLAPFAFVCGPSTLVQSLLQSLVVRRLADTFDDFSDELFAAERNISIALDSTLDDATSAADARIRRVSERMRREMIGPSRLIIQRELLELREAEVERKQQKLTESGTYQARSRLMGRDQWWLSRLDKGGANVRVLERSASVLGLLLLVGALNLCTGLAGLDELLEASVREQLTTAWRLCFAVALAAYFYSLSLVTLTDLREPYSPTTEPGGTTEQTDDPPKTS